MDEIRIKPYVHHAQYYETDQMAIIHHSNYIRWMEEARNNLMDQMGFSYKAMEEMEIISPVRSALQRIGGYGNYHSGAFGVVPVPEHGAF